MDRVTRIYTPCLDVASFVINASTCLAVVDPIRDIDAYIQMAAGRPITHIFMTHLHSDFVGGHVALAEATGAQIVYGPGARSQVQYNMIEALNNRIIAVGDCIMRVLHTPGHTPESACYVLLVDTLTPHCIFTGDSKRPKGIPETVLVYPTHTHGPDSQDRPHIEQLNRSLIRSIKEIDLQVRPLKNRDFRHGDLILDTRPPSHFVLGYVPKSINISSELSRAAFIRWATRLIPRPTPPIVLVTLPGQERETVKLLALVGIETVRGYLDGGYEYWVGPFETITDVEGEALSPNKSHIIDVRDECEYRDGHVSGAINVPLEKIETFRPVGRPFGSQAYYIYCGTGYLSVTAASIMKRRGYSQIYNVAGGYPKLAYMPTETML